MPVGGDHGRKPPNPRYVPKQHGKKPPMGKPNHGRKPAPPPQRSGKTTCCSMVAAVQSVKQGKFRLAARYVRMTPRYVARRFA